MKKKKIIEITPEEKVPLDTNNSIVIPTDTKRIINELRVKLQEKIIENNKLTKELTKVKDKLLETQIENAQLNKQYNYLSTKENDLLILDKLLKDKKEECEKLKDELKKEKKINEKLKNDFDIFNNKELQYAKNVHDNDMVKVENANKIEKINKDFYELILQYENIIDNFEKEEEKRYSKKKEEWIKKTKEMKRSMIDYINKGLSINLNSKQNELNKKLTLIHNNQLKQELESQSLQIEDLLKQREHLDQIIIQFKTDLKVHIQVEKFLSEKNKKYIEMIKILSKKINDNQNKNKEINNFNQNNFLIRSNSNNSLYTNKNDNSFNNYNKLINLEKQIINQKKEIQNLKIENDTLKSKTEYMFDKYSNIIKNLDIVLDKIYNSSDFQDIQQLYLNIDDFKKCDFEKLSPEQQYTVTVMIIKFLQPLVNNSIQEQYDNVHSIDKIRTRFCFGKENQSTNGSISLIDTKPSLHYNLSLKNIKFKSFYDINFSKTTRKYPILSQNNKTSRNTSNNLLIGNNKLFNTYNNIINQKFNNKIE